MPPQYLYLIVSRGRACGTERALRRVASSASAFELLTRFDTGQRAASPCGLTTRSAEFETTHVERCGRLPVAEVEHQGGQIGARDDACGQRDPVRGASEK